MAECNGICLSASDIGVGEYGDMIAYAHPDCPEHGDPLEDDPLRGPVCTDPGCPAGYPHHGPCPGEEDR